MNNTIDFIKNNKIIAIIRKVATANIIPLANALFAGGIQLMEVTFDQSSKTMEQDTCESIKILCEKFGNMICVGAGTVMNIHQVELAVNAGAKYIISPNTNVDVIKKTLEMGAVPIPGALTPSEISFAYESGAAFVKVFPAGELGLNYIKSVIAPLNYIPILAVGGVDENNMKGLLRAGVIGVGVGSNIVNTKLINAGKFGELTSLAKKYTEQIKGA